MDEIITLDYGSGGKKTSRLIEKMILPAFDNDALNALGDGAILTGTEKLVFSTDSFVVDPIFFPGGDIGKLSVCGTVNDVAMCGGEPKYLSCSFIIEEGFKIEELEKIVKSIRDTCSRAGVKIVTGDTKVVDRGRGDKIYINTAGIGYLKYPGLGTDRLQAGDKVILSGFAGDHGTAVMLSRNGMMQGDIRSDCAPLNKLAEAVLSCGADVKILRDPTRGGVATTLNEFVENTGLGIEIQQELVPVRPQVSAACDMLGLDPLYCANEGKMLCIAADGDEEKVLEAMRKTEEGKNACVIGSVNSAHPGMVTMRTELGGSRILQKMAGAQLPRIC